MFMVNKLYLELLFTNLVTNTSGGKEEVTNFPKTKVYLPDIYKHTLTHTHPHNTSGGFYTCYLGHKLSTIPLHPIEKGTKKNPNFTLPP